ncbi:hypothetical protein CPLU01_12895 [Colletotrichum plurivorum]|uniref:Peptidase S33 tripeptidyl aminopeptidase-like C-terminal domain-containing protein n=1 Tax=Colletotrichum plurivorum TaxID=2175906 RepID=A0A8H6JVR2_9PEZI|nr:hypothetical protein CPLU01_12895 [Colletotrichum plurivorum]
MHSSVLLAGSLAALTQAASVPLTARGSDPTTFSWIDTKPTKDLQYHDCGGGFQCARLEVPLDWSDPSKNATAAIAIVKLPATVPDDDPTFGGSILLNPGGPSGSGTQWVYTSGRAFQSVLGGKRNYEMIGFDPRGVNLTTPHADCYDGNEIARTVDTARESGFPGVQDALGYHYQHAAGVSQICEKDGQEGTFAYVNTASVARDMVEIVDRIDELRWKESGKGKPADANVARLQYLGVSYGSYLGSVFASMFPERIERLMIDAIIDPDDFAQGIFRSQINDAEAILDYFYEVCFEAGEECVLRTPGDASAVDIKGRVNEFLDSIHDNPIPIVVDGTMMFVTDIQLDKILFSTLYSPRDYFEFLAVGLNALMTGDHALYARLVLLLTGGANNVTTPTDVPAYTWSADSMKGVVCGDAVDGIGSRNMSHFEETMDFYNEQMPTGGASFAAIWGLPCVGRTIRPPYAFTGPFGSPAPNPDDPKAPAAPLLITSSRLDPITPLRNAITVQKQHPGSAVVIQEGAGHGFLSGPSPCIANIIREYFHTGKVPENGTVCPAACLPSIPASKNCTSGLQTRDETGFVELPVPGRTW